MKMGYRIGNRELSKELKTAVLLNMDPRLWLMKP